MARVRLEIPENLPFTTEIPIRISDINYGGHLGNDAVLSIVHEARVQFFGHHGFTELDVDGTAIMMTDAVIVYRSEGFYGDVLAVEVGVSDMQSAGCDLVYRLRNRETGKEVARVKTGIVFVDPREKKIVPMPAAFRERCGIPS